MFFGISHLSERQYFGTDSACGQSPIRHSNASDFLASRPIASSPLARSPTGRRPLQFRKIHSDTVCRRDANVDFERQTLSIMKACEVVGVSRRTIYNWMAGGKIEFIRTAGGSVRIFADSLWRAPDGPAPQQEIQH
jgi:excisionase family DNA binding protein